MGEAKNDKQKRLDRMNRLPYGTRVPMQALRDAILRGEFKSFDEFNKAFNSCTEAMLAERTKLLDTLDGYLNCKHETWHPPSYTHQHRFAGWVFVFKRTCEGCGKTETKTVREWEQRPDWSEGATERWYNNGF